MTNNVSGSSKIRPRARIIRTIGNQIISSEVVAILELVKNSYDADATHVVIRFARAANGKLMLEIIDNGHGMSLETIQSTWLEPATISKKHNKRSPKKRRVLGEKGIGRFAASRIAKKLQVVTRQENNLTETHAIFDWAKFDDDNAFLEDISVPWRKTSARIICYHSLIDWEHCFDRTFSEDELSHGTILRMKDLTIHWNKTQLDELAIKLRRLVSPRFQKDKDHSFSIFLSTPEQDYAGLIEQPAIFEKPHYIAIGKIENNGEYQILMDYDIKAVEGKQNARKGKDEILEGFTKPLDECKSFEFELRIWDRDTSILDKNERHDLDAIAGINVYRDGFRVLPYGEPDDDWLKLDRRRIQNPSFRISNNQVSGFIFISSDTNSNLADQSNREGLSKNAAYHEFVDAITSIIKEIEAKRYALKNADKVQPDNRKGGIFNDFNLTDLQTEIKRQYPQNTALLNLVQEKQKDLDVRIDQAKDAISRYRRLSALGEIIDNILHDGQTPVSNIVNQAQVAIDKLSRTQNVTIQILQEVQKRFTTVHENADLLYSLFNKIKPFSGRKASKPENFVLENLIRETPSLLAEHDVVIKIPDTKTNFWVDEAEIKIVMKNLLENAVYWVTHAEPPIPEEEQIIEVQVWREGALAKILVADNGHGVPKEYQEHIFDLYFSLKPKGTGQGLFIVGEIVTDEYNGMLELRNRTTDLRGAHFLITLHERL